MGLKMINTEQRKQKVNNFHHTISFEFASVIFLIVFGAILLCFVLNTLFLEPYYKREKQQTLLRAYAALEEAAGEDIITSDEFDVQLVRLTNGYNIGIIVMDADSQTLKCYASDPETMNLRMWQNLFGMNHQLGENEDEDKDDAGKSSAGEDREKEEQSSGEEGDIDAGTQESAQSDTGSSGLARSDTAEENGKDETEEEMEVSRPRQYEYTLVQQLQETDRYRLQIVYEARTSTDYMEMWGFLSNGNLFLIRAPMESIHNSVQLANRFLLYAGLCAALVGVIAATLIARRMTRPIRQMTEISNRMKALDFDAKYTGKGNNELALLGENINELSEVLEQTISELKTANNELRRDIETKEKTDEMRKEFLSNVSHELKTPIALIQGYAEGLQDCINDDPESRDFYCGVIIDEAAKMNNMIKKLMTLNQLEFGQDRVQLEHFDIVSVIRNYLSSAELLAQKDQVTVRMEQRDPIYVWADEFFAEEVFMNYYNNALHHIEGDKVVDIRFRQMENCVRISVFNTGKPIPEESLPHLWEKFYKVDKARTREYGGSGIGLSIVRAIMEALHQDYGVKNYDNGVEFWFDLDTQSKAPAENEERADDQNDSNN